MKTILVVDDEAVIRIGCSRLLDPEGYRILTAENGRQALDILLSEQVDLILCDLLMPVMGAMDLLDEVKRKFPEVPFVIITGHGTVANAVEAMKQGAYDFVTKPFRADHLILIINRALEQLELKRRARRLQETEIRNLYDLVVEKGRFKTIINCMADGVLVTNRYMEIVLHNPAMANLLGLPINLETPAALSEFFADADLRNCIMGILQTCEKEGAQISRDFQREGRHIRSVSAPVPGSVNEVLGTITVFQDVTIYKQLDEMKSNFVQMVSHELRSPLASIKQLQTVILDGLAGDLTGKQKELLGRSQNKIQSLLDLISDLLDVAKIEDNARRQYRTAVNIGEVLEHIVALIRPRAEGMNIALSLEIAEDSPIIKADPRNMEELFSNLISNAINYSPHGGQVAVSTTMQGDFLEVVVSDTGVGIAPEEVPKIFDKFYRVKSPETRHIKGTGLGLAIVKAILDSHQGRVLVDSTPGQGTTFRVLLPAEEQSVASAPASISNHPRA